jgi:hypothetical protein
MTSRFLILVQRRERFRRPPIDRVDFMTELSKACANGGIAELYSALACRVIRQGNRRHK